MFHSRSSRSGAASISRLDNLTCIELYNGHIEKLKDSFGASQMQPCLRRPGYKLNHIKAT